jgi:hypothetical protein
MVAQLQRENSSVVFGWIVHDIGKVAVQGEQNGASIS